MSPKQAEGNPLDARSDIFSFGSVLYEMLSGRQAFRCSSKLSTLSSILRDTPAPLNSVRADVPMELDRIVRRCLEKGRDARYPFRDGASTGSGCMPVASGCSCGGPKLRVAPASNRNCGAGLLALALAMAAWVGLRAYRYRWVYTVALPEIARLADQEKIACRFPAGPAGGPVHPQ